MLLIEVKQAIEKMGGEVPECFRLKGLENGIVSLNEAGDLKVVVKRRGKVIDVTWAENGDYTAWVHFAPAPPFLYAFHRSTQAMPAERLTVERFVELVREAERFGAGNNPDVPKMEVISVLPKLAPRDGESRIAAFLRRCADWHEDCRLGRDAERVLVMTDQHHWLLPALERELVGLTVYGTLPYPELVTILRVCSFLPESQFITFVGKIEGTDDRSMKLKDAILRIAAAMPA